MFVTEERKQEKFCAKNAYLVCFNYNLCVCLKKEEVARNLKSCSEIKKFPKSCRESLGQP